MLEVEEVAFVVEESAIKLFVQIKKINQKPTQNNQRRKQINLTMNFLFKTITLYKYIYLIGNNIIT